MFISINIYYACRYVGDLRSSTRDIPFEPNSNYSTVVERLGIVQLPRRVLSTCLCTWFAMASTEG